MTKNFSQVMSGRSQMIFGEKWLPARSSQRLWSSVFLIVTTGILGQFARQVGADEIEFNRDIRPILSDRCFQCHGPDEKKREAGLRFDLEQEAKQDLGGYRAIVEGDPAASGLIERIYSTDESEQMPPPESGKSLTEKEKGLLKRWIEEGAEFEVHWSFQPLKIGKLPNVENRHWVRNPVDQFILAKLESVGLEPAAEADRRTLIRRLSIDLLGLNPTPEEVDTFLSDQSENAYERLVDRLLESPHFGERMGRHWLDLARYADSNGYANDGLRSIWPYRDWVVNALNDDLPFDQFTVEQLAGDLLPSPTESQLVATGFHRNTPFQTEGGSDFEQYRVERTKNRADTTGAVWLGLTVGCAQCHTHKFDPITHSEYYQLYAFFNSSDEPTLRLQDPSNEREIAELKKELRQVDQALAQEKQRTETESAAQEKPQSWRPVEFERVESLEGASLTKLNDGSILASGKNPPRDTYRLVFNVERPVQAIRLETLTHESLPNKGPGRASNGNFVLAELSVVQKKTNSLNRSGTPNRVRIITAKADHSQGGYDVQDAFDGDPKTGWAINGAKGNSNVDRTAWFALENPVSGPIEIQFATYEQGSGYNIGRFRLSVSSQLPAGLNSKTKRLESTRKAIQARLTRLEKQKPATLIIRERNQPRQAFVQLRGDFLDPGQNVSPGTLAVLPPLSQPQERTANRLDLAKWLVSPDHPLTPRVQANRIWQHLFGAGLVETENDFGYQGSLPSHPRLLDYLANELIAGGWRQKRIYKLIVMSATYRQSSHHRPEAFRIDPKNRLCARQNRYRVEGEVVRDLALNSSGLLSRKFGGPSVFPPIPPNVIGTSSARHRWPTSQGEDRYRRGLYTAIYRANVYPMLLAFDGPDRDNACTRRSKSNTPLQALTIANDPAFIEMAIAFGDRIRESEIGGSANDASDDDPFDIEVKQRIVAGYRLAFSREPTAAESERLQRFFDDRLQFYQSRAEEAGKLAEGASPERAAWIAVARVLLNLDEFITRE